MMKKFFLSIIVFIIILSISVCAVDFTPQGNINLRSVYSIINGVDINASNFYGNFTGDLTGTASIATLWASVTSFASDWFYDSGNVLSFNETLMNSTIDARNNDTKYSAGDYLYLNSTEFNVNESDLNNTIDARSNFDSKWALDGTWIYNKSDSLSFNTTSGDNRYANITDLASEISLQAANNVTQATLINLKINTSSEGDLNVNHSTTSGIADTATTWDGETSQADLNVNSSDYWDSLNTPSDIGSDDITDDGTWIVVGDEANLNVNSSDYWDDLGSPSDINAGDITDDGTYYNTTANINATGYSVTADNFYGSYDWTSGDTWNTFDGTELLFNESKLEVNYFNASSVDVVTGTGTGNLADIQTYNGVPYNVTETNSDYELIVNFTGVTEFSTLIIRHKTNLDSGHATSIQIWDYSDSSWEDYGILTESTTYKIKTLGVYNYADHVNGSNPIRVRFYQVAGPPNTAHVHNFDWVILSKGFGTPVGQEIDPLSIHKDGNNELTANWDAGSYNITATSFIGNLTGTSDIATTWDSETSQADLNVNNSDMLEGTDLGTLTDGKTCIYDLSNTEIDCDTTLTVGTVTSVATDDIYLTGGAITSSGTITFNETVLNVTIDARDTDTTYTAGNGINISGTTFSVAGNTALTQDSDGLSVTADGIGDTQLTYNTGQALTTTSNPEFATLNTGQGNYELYSMDQDVLEKSEVVFAQINVTDNLTLNNNVWLRALNNAGTSFVNMFKVNTDDVIEAGANFSIGAIRIVEDSGVINLVDMSVSSTPAINTEEGYNFSIDGEPFLKIFAGADGSGGLKDKAIWISDNVSVKFDNGAKISVNSTCMSMYSPNGTGIIDVCD